MNFGVETFVGVVVAEDRGDLARSVPVRVIGIVYTRSALQLAVKAPGRRIVIVGCLPFSGLTWKYDRIPRPGCHCSLSGYSESLGNPTPLALIL